MTITKGHRRAASARKASISRHKGSRRGKRKMRDRYESWLARVMGDKETSDSGTPSMEVPDDVKPVDPYTKPGTPSMEVPDNLNPVDPYTTEKSPSRKRKRGTR